MTQMHHAAKRLLAGPILAVCALLSACQGGPMPQPDYPLSEETVSAALKESALSWEIEEARTSSGEGVEQTIYSLRPTEGEDGSQITINSYQSDGSGPRLQIHSRWRGDRDPEDWQKVLRLAARLYGGFQDEDEICWTCVPPEAEESGTVSWQGALRGRYLTVSMGALSPWDSDQKILSIQLYQSKEVYDQIQAEIEEMRGDRMQQPKDEGP